MKEGWGSECLSGEDYCSAPNGSSQRGKGKASLLGFLLSCRLGWVEFYIISITHLPKLQLKNVLHIEYLVQDVRFFLG